MMGNQRRGRPWEAAGGGAGGGCPLTTNAPSDPHRPSRSWRERGPLALAALLIIGGVLVISASLLLSPRRSGLAPGGVMASGSSTATAIATSSPPASSGSSVPHPTATATAVPTPRVIAEAGIDLTWRAVATLPGTPGAQAGAQTVVATGLVASPSGGYVALGEIVDGFLTETGATGPIHPAIWVSPDGVAWRLGDASGLGQAVAFDVASDGHQLLVVASTAQSTVVLRSPDARAWTAVSPSGARIARVVAGGPGFVALGERLATHRSAIWTTANGTSWRLAWESTIATGEELSGLAVRPSGQILAAGLELQPGGGVGASAVVSDDAVSWRRIPASNLPQTMGFDAIGAGADGAWYAAGFDDAAGGIGIWRSGDGSTWRSTLFGPGQLTELPGDTGSSRAVFGFDHATFVLAFTSCCGDPPQRTLVSRDGGSWMRANRSTLMRGVRLTATLPQGGRLLAVGTLARGAGVWAATAAPSGGVELPTELNLAAEAGACVDVVGEVRVRLEVDRNGPVARVRLVRADGGDEFGPIVWPYGWSAAAGTPLEVRDRSRAVVAREGDELVLANGAVIAGSYHLCRIDGQPATTR
jgi:hypothetical protein